jgi:circadian clock protein KaiB
MGATEVKPWVLRLYVTDATPKSARAVVNARRLLEEHLHDRYSLEIVNIAEHVAQADLGVASVT